MHTDVRMHLITLYCTAIVIAVMLAIVSVIVSYGQVM